MFGIVSSAIGALAILVATTAAIPVGPADLEAVDAISDGYRPPVVAPIADGFRLPAHRFGPGNRGLEYRTRRGQAVVAAGDGVVSFAGPVAGRLVVTLDHADGLRTTYTGLASATVTRGEAVRGGDRVGTATARLHFGVAAGDAHLDPGALLDPAPRRAHLVAVHSR